MNKYICVLILIALAFVGKSQSNAPFIISSAGAVSEAEGKSIAYTVGQYVVFPVLKAKNQNVVTQNFQEQVAQINTSVKKASPTNLELKVFPNPTTQYVNINFTDNQEGEFDIHVFDIMGRKILSSTTFGTAITKTGLHSYNIDLKEIANGQYLVRVVKANTSTFMASFKIIKQNR